MKNKKKTLSIIQPSFFPYFGYFQMISKSDIFIFYDHVQYDKHGWRNRNKILINNKPSWITAPVTIDHDNEICNVKIFNPEINLKKIFKTIKQNYSKYPNYKKIISLLEDIFFTKKWKKLSEFNIYATLKIAEYLNIKNTKFHKSSDLINLEDKNFNLINHCKNFKCTNYLSGKLAKNYLNEDLFKKNDIDVDWFKIDNIKINELLFYDHQYLSIIDTLFRVEKISKIFD